MASDPRSDFTRTGVRRAGDDYQDALALDLFVEWLEHPERYTVMRVEADDSGFLDDVLAEGPHEVVAVQVKFSAHPDAQDDSWDLESLLAERDGKRTDGRVRKLPSLLAKWGGSVRTLRMADVGKSVRARVVSNRKPAPAFRELLDPERRIQSERLSDRTRTELARQLGDTALADIGCIAFELDQPALDTLEDAVRRRFLRLGFDDRGWLNLKDELRGWVRHRNEPAPDGRITLDVVRRAAGWHDLRGLPQDFLVPDDYVLPSEEFHRRVHHALVSGTRCLVLTGAPGFGKSTYASYLYKELRSTSCPVVRHHYYLFQAERALSRLEHRVAAESLMHDMVRDHGDALGNEATRQPDPARLREVLEACGKHYHSRGSRLIVMLDGLDHVWREQRSVQQLNELLDELLPLPIGVVLLVATQPIADDQLPHALLKAAPREEWLWLPKLGHSATEEWIRHHLDAFAQTEGNELHDHAIEALATAFFAISGGHPLHLRYSLQALRERGVRIDEVSIRSLPPCPTDEITDYYAALMLTLPQGARLVLALFASAQFSWPRSGLLECLQQLGTSRPDAIRAVTDTMHLLSRDAIGLRPFHSSLLAFIAQQEDLTDNLPIARRITLGWLQTAAPGHWRCSYEWILQAATGDVAPLVNGPDRQWAIEAVATRRSPDAVERILSESGRLACTAEQLPTSLERGATLGYWADIAQSHQSVAEQALFAQLILQEDPLLRARLSSCVDDLTDREVHLLAESAFDAGDTRLVERCFESLRTRLNTSRLRSPEHEAWPVRVAPVLATAALADEASSALKFSLSDTENATTFVSALVSQLVRSKRIAELRSLWREVLAVVTSGQETGGDVAATMALAEVASGLALLGLEEHLDVGEVFHELTVGEPLIAIYAVIRRPSQRPDHVPIPALSLPPVRWLDATQSAVLSRRVHDVFRSLLANHLLRREDINDAWLANLTGEQWATDWLRRLERAASYVAACLVDDLPVTLESLYVQFADLPFPRWATNRDEAPMQYAMVARKALFRIGCELLQLTPVSQSAARLSEADIRAVSRSSYFEMRGWLDDYLERRRRWLAPGALEFILSSQRAILRETVEQFYERASVYAQLAGVAALHDRADVARDLLRDVARNLLSHGHHKDMLLFHALESIRLHYRMRVSAALTGPALERDWLLQLAVPVAHVTDYTDGDETHGLPDELADALGEVAPDLLLLYHLGLSRDEEYDDASHAFRRVVEVLPADDPIGAAVLSTVVDDRARQTLAERAERGDASAGAVAEGLTAYLGPASARPRDSGESSGVMTNEERVDVDPAGYPPSRLDGYLEALKAHRLYDTNEYLERWLTSWVANGGGAEAFEAARLAAEKRVLYQPAEAMWRTARLLHGRDAAFEWLVQAQRESGWNKWFSRREDSETRWNVIRGEHPHRWFEFLQRSFEPGTDRGTDTFAIGHFSWVRVVDYLITVGQVDLASRCVATMVTVTMDLVSAAMFSPPTWLRDSRAQGVGRES